MLKIFLVEDESIMREGLRDNMPWQQFGYEFVGEAADGENALPLIRKTRPDVLLTDIKMPFMDGLSLSRIVAKEFPNMKIIILSGYDDFEYARQAIQIGVEQYILKPVTRETLKKVLSEVKDKIDSEREKKINMERIQSERREYELMSRRTFFEKVFSGRLSVQEIYTEMEKLSIQLEGPYFNLILVGTQRKAKGAGVASGNSQKFVRCQDEMMHYFMRFPEYVIFNWNMNTYGILIKGEQDMMDSYTRRALQNITRIYSQIEDEYDWHATQGTPVARLSLLSECYEEANHQLSLQY
ncbi:MAG: response regulator, partial [Lachnospiraceae bacterium]|nr:response regulator [Lachnospiraceae bacterium]